MYSSLLRKASGLTFVAGLLLALMVGCSGPIPLSRTAENTGTLSISVPRLASWVSEQLKAQSSGSRAYAIADTVKVEIKTAGGVVVFSADPVNWTVGTDYFPGYDEAMSDITGIPVGSDYTVVVSIYNQVMSSTEPQVRGEVSGVVVSEGEVTPVSVVCKPLNPIPLTIDGGFVTAAIAANGERWYVANLTAGTPYYWDTVGPMALFDHDGKIKNLVYPYVPAEDGPVYICAVDFDGFGSSSARGETSVSLSTTMVVINEGSTGSPVPLNLDEDHEFLLAGTVANAPSYYSFTATEAGVHALETKYYYFSYELYSDSGFSTLIDQGMFVNFGKFLPSLTSGSTYYLKLTSPFTYNSRAGGRIMSPSGISTATLSEGTSAVPVVLSLGSSESGTVGYRFFDTSSYYRFTTDANGHADIALTVSGTTGDTLVLKLDNSPLSTNGPYDFKIETSTTDHIFAQLSPSMTYYLMVSNDSDAIQAGRSTGYTLTVTTSANAPSGAFEGSQASPVPLTLNEEHTFKVGASSSGYNTSYYWFETTNAGDYALDIESSGASVYLYSDPGFATQVASNITGYGAVFTGLSGATPYYLKITNTSGERINHPGRVVDASTIAASREGEGSLANPVVLAIGSLHTGKVGKHSYDYRSYYRFTTGDEVDYTLTVPRLGEDAIALAYLSANSGYSQILTYSYFRSGFQLREALAPNTTYYLQITNMEMRDDVAVPYSIGIDATPITDFVSLPVSSSLTPGSIAAKFETVWYEANVTGGSTYSLTWEEGTNTSIAASAFHENRATSYFRDQSESSSPRDITVPSDESKLYVLIRVPSGSEETGTFSLKLELVP